MSAAASSALSVFARAWREPFADALAFKAVGGRVVGYLSANAPVELIEAAGLFALRLDGGGVMETPRADVFLEGLFDPTVRGVCERLLAGELDFLDALILPRTTDSVQRLYYYLCEQQRAAGLKLPRLIFYDLLHTLSHSSAEHNYAALLRVRDALADVAGGAIEETALGAAITISNRRRAALTTVLARRIGSPAALNGMEALQVISASRRMAAMPFIAAAEALAVMLDERGADVGARVVLAGNAPDTLDLHAAIEAAGAVVVGDYHDRGELSIGALIHTDDPPLRALSDVYHCGGYSPRVFPTRADEIVTFARERGAVGVVFFYYAQEEVLTWDYPAQRDALMVAGIPSLCLSGQAYRIDAAQVGQAVAPFVSTFSKGAP